MITHCKICNRITKGKGRTGLCNSCVRKGKPLSAELRIIDEHEELFDMIFMKEAIS